MDLHFYDCILKKLGAFGEMRGKGDGFCGRAEVVGVRHFLSCIHTQLYFVFCICAFHHFLDLVFAVHPFSTVFYACFRFVCFARFLFCCEFLY